MDYRCLSKAETAKLDEAVKTMFRKKNEGLSYSTEYEFVKSKTELLFFLIPYRSFYIARELCSEFYLYMLPKVDIIINSYRITSNVPYVAYLHIVLRTRTKNFIFQKEKQKLQEERFLTGYVQIEDGYDIFESEPPYCLDEEKDYENFSEEVYTPSLSELIDSIVSSEPLALETDSEVSKKLLAFLSNTLNRKKFLAFIMNNYRSLTDKEIEVLAEIMNVSPNAFANLSLKLHDLNEHKFKHIDKAYDQVINRYWKRYLIILAALSEDTVDKKRRKELETQKNLLISKIRIKQQRKSDLPIRGTPANLIATGFNCSAGCIYNWSREVESILEAIVAEEEEEYLFN